MRMWKVHFFHEDVLVLWDNDLVEGVDDVGQHSESGETL